MTRSQPITMNQHLRNISDILLINGTLLESSGLWYGKMGVAIFFFHYAQYTGNELFEDYAVEIIHAIQTDIHNDSIISYDHGLAGIGVGIEYLSQNGFLSNDTNNVLEDFDRRIRRDIMYQQQENNNLANGLCGLGQYLLFRINDQQTQANEFCLLINQEMMIHVVNILENEKHTQTRNLSDILTFLCRLYTLNICNSKIDRYVDKVLTDFTIDDISDELLYVWALTLLRIVPLRGYMADWADQIINKAVQMMEQTDVHSTNNLSMNKTNKLFWLLQCKKLIGRSGIRTCLIGRLDTLMDKILEQDGDELRFEKGNLSIRGCAGHALALMTISGQCNDTWLDLLE